MDSAGNATNDQFINNNYGNIKWLLLLYGRLFYAISQ